MHYIGKEVRVRAACVPPRTWRDTMTLRGVCIAENAETLTVLWDGIPEIIRRDNIRSVEVINDNAQLTAYAIRQQCRGMNGR